MAPVSRGLEVTWAGDEVRVDTRASAVAAGTVGALSAFAATLLTWMHAGAVPAPPLARAVLFGYSVDPVGAVVGGMWGYAYGALLGASFAFVYNLAATPSDPPVGPGPDGE